MNTINIKIKYEDWYNNYPVGITISEIEFDSEYIRNNIQEGFIKLKLFDFAFLEEWNLDFFDTSEEERQEMMCLELYKNLFNFKELRIETMEYNKFSKDFI